MAPRTLLAMVDIAHRDNALALCHEAASHLRPDDTLHVAYVMPYAHFSYVEPYVSADSIKAAAARAHEELTTLCKDAGLTAKEHVLRGSVGEQALLLAKDLNPDMVLLNAHRPGIQMHTLGSHAAQIVRHAPCTVLVKK